MQHRLRHRRQRRRDRRRRPDIVRRHRFPAQHRQRIIHRHDRRPDRPHSALSILRPRLDRLQRLQPASKSFNQSNQRRRYERQDHPDRDDRARLRLFYVCVLEYRPVLRRVRAIVHQTYSRRDDPGRGVGERDDDAGRAQAVRGEVMERELVHELAHVEHVRHGGRRRRSATRTGDGCRSVFLVLQRREVLPRTMTTRGSACLRARTIDPARGAKTRPSRARACSCRRRASERTVWASPGRRARRRWRLASRRRRRARNESLTSARSACERTVRPCRRRTRTWRRDTP